MTSNLPRGSYGRYLKPLLAIADMAVVNGAFWMTVLWFNAGHAVPQLRLVWLLACVAYLPVLWGPSPRSMRAVDMEHIVHGAFRAVVIHGVCFLLMLAFLDLRPWSLAGYFEFYGLTLVALPVWWTVARLTLKALRRRGRNSMAVVIVGTGDTALRLYDALINDPGYGYKVKGFFGTYRPLNRLPERWLGTLDSLEHYLRTRRIEEVFYAMSGDDPRALDKVTGVTDDLYARLYYVPPVSHALSRNYALSHIGPVPVMLQRPNPMALMRNRVLKRAFDILFSTAFLVVSPLIFIPVAVAIKLSSPGPVFFVQQRTGYRGRPFRCFKFRTMRVNAAADTAQAVRHDPRTTRVGELLRKTSVDELPQFLNVLRGDMSVVGPRPHMLRHTQEYRRLVDKYMVRHAVKPGITGWAQVCGWRGPTDQVWKMERRVECDVWYIENWSLLLDLKIIVRTVFNSARGEANAF